ncbi:MAG: DUF2283 domain-containing protein [Rothia sp. (in: high G+C Gram-positive bacteria)]|nr:DUF2283 domain-containing protein [Rothia sp. (in: high G+C Gram-positive bacteria)]
MNIEYDIEVDAAYISLANIEPGDVYYSSNSVQPKESPGQINLDFDSSGRLLGIEVLSASLTLHRELLSQYSK